MKTFLGTIFSLVLAFTISSTALALEVLKLDTGHYVAVEVNIVNAEKPTLILLPGVFRALDLRDEFVQLAKKQKVNFISIHSSLHPESVKEIPANETPYFKYKTITTADLASEVVSVINYYEVQNPVPVSLSYSSTISTELAKSGNFPVIIETAPMIRFDESDPSGASVTQFWKNYFDLFPITGGFWKAAYLKQTYEYYWSKEIDNLLKRYPEYNQPGLKQNLVTSFAALSIAADGFDFSKQKFSAKTKRYFILGQNEEPTRADLQKKAISLYEQQTGDQKSTAILQGAGHIIPSDVPQAYLNLIKKTVFGK